MTFWGVEVKPGEPFTLKSEELGGLLMLTQATLGNGSSPKKSVLQVKVGDKDPIFLCTLLPQKMECFLLNLEFDEEDDVTFSVVGPTSIHLSGIAEVAEEDENEDDIDFDNSGEDIADSGSEGSEFESDDASEDDSIMDDDMPMYQNSAARNRGVVIEEIEDDEKPVHENGGNKQVKKKGLPTSEDEDGFPVSSSKKLEANKEKAKKRKNTAKDDDKSASNLKRKVDAVVQDQQPKSDATDGDASADKKKKKKNKKKSKIEKDETVADVEQNFAEEDKKISKAVTETKQAKDTPAKLKTFANGLIIEDLVMGKPNAKTASRGKKVSVRYIGKLKKGGKIFDSNTSGKPFKFKLGIGEVIKGWDVGVEGMRVGGKRRLTIPPSMGYGSSGVLPQIPPNAWLLFDVELVDVA
ncbi:hypothetical protein RND81_14G124700 [Saponaria officinalis]|uniref:FK506-binding protein n=2 Tax=Saponaria officinalis TaxID=3572 RepID=A0AAW1GLM7_SAPOF